jgi:hypothetical protein
MSGLDGGNRDIKKLLGTPKITFILGTAILQYSSSNILIYKL